MGLSVYLKLGYGGATLSLTPSWLKSLSRTLHNVTKPNLNSTVADKHPAHNALHTMAMESAWVNESDPQRLFSWFVSYLHQGSVRLALRRVWRRFLMSLLSIKYPTRVAISSINMWEKSPNQKCFIIRLKGIVVVFTHSVGYEWKIYESWHIKAVCCSSACHRGVFGFKASVNVNLNSAF